MFGVRAVCIGANRSSIELSGTESRAHSPIHNLVRQKYSFVTIVPGNNLRCTDGISVQARGHEQG